MNTDNNKKFDEKESYVAIPLRHASIGVALLILAGFLLVLIGYFWGKREAVEQFNIKLTQESFSDQIYTSLCSLYEYEPDEDGSDESQEGTMPPVQAQAQELAHAAPEANTDQGAAAVQSRESMPVSDLVGVSEQPIDANLSAQEHHYYAQLIGFGVEKKAEDFAERIKKRGYEVHIEKKLSRSKKGTTVAWYQVITQRYTDRDALSKIVDRISKEETLKGVRIITG